MNRGPVSSQILVRRVPVQGLMPEVASASKYIQYSRYGGLFREGREPHKEPSILDFQERTTNLHLETSCPCPSILLVVFERGLAVGHLTREGCEWGKCGTPSIVGEEIGRVIIIIVITRSRPIPFVKWLHSRPYYDGCEMPQRGRMKRKG